MKQAKVIKQYNQIEAIIKTLEHRQRSAQDPETRAELAERIRRHKGRAKALKNIILLFIDEIPAKWRPAVTLAIFEGLTPAEIAERLGLSVETVKNYTSHARSRINSLAASAEG